MKSSEIAQHAAVIDPPLARGHMVLFLTNPFWRGHTSDSDFLVFNAILNVDDLGSSGNSVGHRVEIEAAAVEVDGGLEVLAVAESARRRSRCTALV